MTNKKHKTGSQGFTLIELLIVVALLGALAALVLPSMSANRTKAMEATCDYNQVSTIKTLSDHYALNGALPDMLHTGRKTDATTQAVGTDLMDVPGDTTERGNTLDNMADVARTVFEPMSAAEVASCNAAGLTTVVYDDGATATALATANVGFPVAANDDSGFLADDGHDITFNGHNLLWWNGAEAGAGGVAGRVFMTFISPITDWTTSGDNDWGKGLDSTVSVKKAGECKVPTDSEFNYYIAYIKAFSSLDADGEGIPAILVGTSCPECGVTNP